MKQVLAEVISNTSVMPNVNVLWLASSEIAAATKPGQFVMVRCGDGYDPFLRRPLSIHRLKRDNGEGAFGLLIGISGDATNWLAQRCVGNTIDVIGPIGRGFDLKPTSRNLLLIGGGYGIAPLIGFAEEATAQGRSVTLLAGAASSAQVFPAELLPPEVEMFVATADGSQGRKGMVTELVADFKDWADQIFACGPVPMYRSLAEVMRKIGISASVQVLMEERMACGLGACMGCSIQTRRGRKRVCVDGPMFELSELLL